MSSILLNLPELLDNYKKWVSLHPQRTSDFETTVKWLSYFIAGRINNSHIVSELVYSLSNLLVLFNDRIIVKSQKATTKKTGEKIKLWLTVIEYSEVFLELSAKQLWGNTGKWIIVLCVQVIKCASKLLLLYKHNENIIPNPPIPILERRLVQENGHNHIENSELKNISFTLKRSGKVIRKVDSSPPINLRNWKPLNGVKKGPLLEVIPEEMRKQTLYAETIYISKPLVHLGAMAMFGTNTWKPWMISLLLDLASLHLHTRNTPQGKKQTLLLAKRRFALLLYLLRSPFYDQHSKTKITKLLSGMSNNIPLLSFICEPILRYIPHWQSNYFYMWSS